MQPFDFVAARSMNQPSDPKTGTLAFLRTPVKGVRGS